MNISTLLTEDQKLVHIATSDWDQCEIDGIRAVCTICVNERTTPLGNIPPLSYTVAWKTLIDYLEQGAYTPPSEDRDEIRLEPAIHIANRIIKHHQLHRRYPRLYRRNRHRGFITANEAEARFSEPPDF